MNHTVIKFVVVVYHWVTMVTLCNHKQLAYSMYVSIFASSFFLFSIFLNSTIFFSNFEFRNQSSESQIFAQSYSHKNQLINKGDFKKTTIPILCALKGGGKRETASKANWLLFEVSVICLHRINGK